MTRDELWQERRLVWGELAALAPDLRWYAEEVGFLAVAAGAPDLPPVAADGGLEAALGARHIVELRLWPQQRVYVPHSLLVYVLAAAGASHPRGAHRRLAREGKLSWLAAEVYDLLLAAPPAATMTVEALRERLGAGGTSAGAIARALDELAHRLLAGRAGGGNDARWIAWQRAEPDLLAASRAISQVQAAAALVSKWLGIMLIETEAEAARFFTPLLSTSRVHAALRGLAAARELTPDEVDGRPAWRLAGRAAAPASPPAA